MYTLDRILCPTDFSTSSENAIQVAVDISQKFNSIITLMYVDEFGVMARIFYEQDEQQLFNHRKRVIEYATDKFNDIIKKFNLSPNRVKHAIKFGTAYKEIIQEGEQGEYSMLAISTHGMACSSPHLIGRTAERIVRLSRTPVLTIGQSTARRLLDIKTILCPTDFSEYGNYALPYAISLARTFSAKLHLLHVTSITVNHTERLLEQFPNPQLYHQFANEVTIERMVDKDIEPENAIVRIANEYQIDLIVMGTHGGGGIRRVQIGNTTEEVVRRVEMPVLSITHPIHKVIFPHRFYED